MKAHDMEDLPPDMLALLAESDAHRVIYPTPAQPVAQTDADFLRTAGMDGVKWAAGFKAVAERLGHHGMDEGWLIGWFCNAIMAGFDEAERRNREAHPATPAPVEAGLREAIKAINALPEYVGEQSHVSRGAVLAALRAQSAPVGGEGMG